MRAIGFSKNAFFSFRASCHQKSFSFQRGATTRRASSLSRAGSPEKSLLQHIVKAIKYTGPITIAEYMRLVLTNPVSGFYMNQDVFGSKGHFTTSPEISQAFGELVAVWLINEWQRVGSPQPLNIIELGPGRGTLSSDISRVLSQFSMTKSCSALHLVEISPHLQKVQKKSICGTSSDKSSEMSTQGIPVNWYQALEQVPKTAGFNAFVAHEFFDALPIHRFQRTKDNKFSEVLIDFNEKEELRFIISRNETPASKVLVDKDEVRDQIEVCPQAAIITEQIVSRITDTNGCFLICDYGYDDPSRREKVKDTFRAFKNHALFDALKEPGSADLTADVDFDYIRRHVKDRALVFGTIDQKHFLRSLGIEIRLEKLMESATSEEQKNAIKSGINMIVNEMGQRFKLLSIFPQNNSKFFQDNPPAGFL